MVFDWAAANEGYIARHGVTVAECEEAYRNGPMVRSVLALLSRCLHSIETSIQAPDMAAKTAVPAFKS